MLVAEHRRAKVVGRATKARQVVGPDQDHAMDRMKSKVHAEAAENAATSEVMASETLEDKFKALENADKVELVLNEMKSRLALPPGQ
jgi:phage shock protein A